MIVSVAVPPAAIVAGAMVLVRPTPDADTVIGALAGGAVPAFVCRSIVVLVTVPIVVDVTVTTIVQPPAGTDAPPGNVIDVAFTPTPTQVPALPPTVVRPAGIVSVNGAVSVIAAAFALPSVMVSVAVPPDGIVPGTALEV